MNLLFRIIFIVFIVASKNVSALTISVLENTPSSVVYSKILKEIYQRTGIPLEFVVLPTQRSLAQSARGIIDGELVRIHEVGNLYPTLIRVPTPYTFFESRAFARTPDIQQDIQKNGWSALNNYRVGIVRGMKHAEIGLKDIKDVVAVDRTDQLFKMLERERVDIAISTSVSALALISKLNLQSIHLIDTPLKRHDLYHYLHVKNKHFIPMLDETIRAMKEAGELLPLKDKFIAELLESE